MRENVLMTGSTGFIGSHVNILGTTMGQSLLRLWMKKRVKLHFATEERGGVLLVHEATLRAFLTQQFVNNRMLNRPFVNKVYSSLWRACIKRVLLCLNSCFVGQKRRYLTLNKFLGSEF
jgi:hypothetical protein